MSILCLEIEPSAPSSQSAIAPIAFRTPRFVLYPSSGARFPVKGFLFSILVHELAIAAMILIPPLLALRNPRWQEKHWEVTMLSGKTIYLPPVGGGREGSGLNQDNEPAPAHSAKRGLTYPGNQPIVSNVPNPTNYIQTILQPDLPNLPILNAFVPLPNKVLVNHQSSSLVKHSETPKEDSQTVLSKPQESKPPLALAEETRTIDAPKLTLPTAASPAAQLSTALPPPAVSAVPSAAPGRIEESKGIHPLPLSLSEGKASLLNQLVISPVMVPKSAQIDLPNGEARGQFAISPNPEPTPPGANNLPSGAAVGAQDGAEEVLPGSKVGDAALGAAGGVNTGKGKGRGGTGDNVAPGLNSVGSGAGTGIGIGHGGGSIMGTGSGAGAGPGSGPFAGMTIQGAEGPVASVATSGANATADEDFVGGSYGITIVSTGNSGGVEDFGIFHDEAVFTVYLDPSTSTGKSAPLWPLQYSILNLPNLPLSNVSPPVIAKKIALRWPADLAAKYAGQQIVLTAEIDAEGKLQQQKILQSPSARLSEVLLGILAQWVFRPAKLNGEPVALKIVLGVPITPQH